MSWTNPPPSVVNARDLLLQLPTVTASVLPAMNLAQRQARNHYPRSTEKTDAFPLFVHRRERYGSERVNAIGYSSNGRQIVHLYVDASVVDDGTLETWGEGIVDDLVSIGADDIQYATDAECGESVNPSPQMLAAAVSGQPDESCAAFRVISISWNWGTA